MKAKISKRGFDILDITIFRMKPANIKNYLTLLILLGLPISAFSEESHWNIGAYAGQYYDTEPAGFTQSKAGYLNQYIVAMTAYKEIWRTEVLPVSLEVDAMIGRQFGLASVSEIAVAPVVRWRGFPWNSLLQTSFRFGPLGVSYTDKISPLERGPDGNGANTLNFLVAELTFALPQMKSNELFLRLHHRCTIFDLINKYGANGQDFFALGYRQPF